MYARTKEIKQGSNHKVGCSN